ncbi:MAG: transposase [Acidobacteriota bacterium]
MMAAAADNHDDRVGRGAVIQTFGSCLKWNPHIHAFVSPGVFDRYGSWQPVPYVDIHGAELLHRIYQVHPLTCTRCGSEMRRGAFMTQPRVIRRLLDHLRHKASR